MARPRLNTVNFVYTTLGLAVAGGIGYYVWRTLKNRRVDRDTEDNLMDIRRASRKAGRAVKDTASQIGKTVKRGASDVGESFEDGIDAGKELVSESTSFGTQTSSSGLGSIPSSKTPKKY